MEAEEEILKKANEELTNKLHEAMETLEAIRNGEVDAIVLKDSKGKQIYSLINPDHPYQVFFDNMDEAAIILSKDQTILYGNNNFFELIEAQPDLVIGTSILDIVAESDRVYFTGPLQKERKKKTELIIVTKKHKTRTALVSVFNGIWEEAEQMCLLFRDITDLKRAQHYVRASETISKILSEAPQLSIASKSILQILNEYLGWEVMNTWLWNKEKQKFHCIDIAHIENISIETFKNKTLALEAKSKPLFSYVAINRPVWIRDITEDSSFLRRNEAIENGLQGALAFSFNQNSDLAGFVELFRRTPFTENIDNIMLDLISSIAIGLGLYIQKLFNNQIKFQFSKALELSLNSIYSTDLNGVIMSWYPGAEKMYGWTAEEMIGTSVKKIYPNNSNEFDQISKTILSGKPIENFVSTRVGKEGNQIWVNGGYDAIHDFFGKISEIIVVEQDITAQKDIARLLEESNKKYESFIELTEEWICDLDKNGNLLFSNLMVYSILGYQAEEILGKSVLYFVQMEDRDKIENQFKNYAAKKEGWRNLVIRLLHKNGSFRWVETKAKALLGTNNELLGFRVSNRDITESKNLEKIKNEFISIMSHEFRTPLTSIYTGLNLLISKKDLSKEDQQDLIANAYRNSIRLKNLINDTMDFEKLQLGKLKFDYQKIDLKEVILESIKSSDSLAHKFNVKIVSESLPSAQVLGDYYRLIQVMINLLSNAIKFSPVEGTVRVSLVKEGGNARVSVTDSGPGIPKEFESKLFQSFSQADSSNKRAAEGTGLGLYISKSIIEAHGGHIAYKTKIGEGTTFFFDIPIITG